MSNARILVIYTGGTIGMVPSANGLVPGDDIRQRLHQALDTLPVARREALPTFELLALTPLIDSSNATPRDWLALIALIQAHHAAYHGIVILHGTDTLAWCSAFLGSTVAALPVPIIVTGSQRPLGVPHSDALENVELALQAATCGQSGVVVAFGDQLLEGVAVRKWSTHADHGFVSPNQAVLAQWPVQARFSPLPAWVSPEPSAILVNPAHTPLPQVVRVVLWPGIPASMVDMLLSNADGAVLEVWGSGNIPEDPALRHVLKEAALRGVLLVAISQCPYGPVDMTTYAAGQALLNSGVINGETSTPERVFAALFMACLCDSGAVDRQARLQRLLGLTP